MGEFFIISMSDEIEAKFFYNAKKDIFLVAKPFCKINFA
jgi:hypothetical protein